MRIQIEMHEVGMSFTGYRTKQYTDNETQEVIEREISIGIKSFRIDDYAGDVNAYRDDIAAFLISKNVPDTEAISIGKLAKHLIGS